MPGKTDVDINEIKQELENIEQKLENELKGEGKVSEGTTPDKVSNTDKTLDVTSGADLKQKVSDVKVFGDPDTWQLVCKASSESQGWMKSTKVMNILGGCLVQVSTQQKNSDGSYAIAEAVTFVANNHFRDGKIGPM